MPVRLVKWIKTETMTKYKEIEKDPASFVKTNVYRRLSQLNMVSGV